MITIETIYFGELNTKVKHLKSGSIIHTDAPVDNLGKGQTFSPTDLLAASLGSCMLTLMGISAQTRSINLYGTRLEITKNMVNNPRKVSEIIIAVYIAENNYSETEKKILEHAAINCPVAKSLHPDIIQNVIFHY